MKKKVNKTKSKSVMNQIQRKIKRKKPGVSAQGIKGWLILIILGFFYSALTSSYLLIQRLVWAFTEHIGWGVFISMFLLFIYCSLIWYSIFLLLTEKKRAVNTSIIALISGFIFLLWYNFIGQLILYIGENKQQVLTNGIFQLFINLLIIIAIALYFKNSKRVKNTFVK
ncbi:MAG: DUF2569 family protein [archaeon]|nr:DUF2569 family protein [archaeon]